MRKVICFDDSVTTRPTKKNYDTFCSLPQMILVYAIITYVSALFTAFPEKPHRLTLTQEFFYMPAASMTLLISNNQNSVTDDCVRL